MENFKSKIRVSFRRIILSCAMIGLAVSASLCFAQENQKTSQEERDQERGAKRQESERRLDELKRRMEESKEKMRQRLREMSEEEPNTWMQCDSAVPEVCWNIYYRNQRRLQEEERRLHEARRLHEEQRRLDKLKEDAGDK